LVSQKQFYSLVMFDKFIGYLKCTVCFDSSPELVDVKTLKLSHHDKVRGIYIPSSDFCPCDGLPDEWMNLIPNITSYNDNL
jgi:hypothetical protein